MRSSCVVQAQQLVGERNVQDMKDVQGVLAAVCGRCVEGCGVMVGVGVCTSADALGQTEVVQKDFFEKDQQGETSELRQSPRAIYLWCRAVSPVRTLHGYL